MLGESAARFDHVVSVFERVRRLYGFQPVQVPVFEATSVFSRSLGETTDVVAKEMYTFDDRGGDSLTLRPEFTAGIARAYVSEGWQQWSPLKLAAWGPLFRYRSEEHTSELQSLMRISYAVFCLKKKNIIHIR